MPRNTASDGQIDNGMGVYKEEIDMTGRVTMTYPPISQSPCMGSPIAVK